MTTVHPNFPRAANQTSQRSVQAALKLHARLVELHHCIKNNPTLNGAAAMLCLYNGFIAPELKVERGGYSNPLTHTMGNYLPIMYSGALKQMAGVSQDS